MLKIAPPQTSLGELTSHDAPPDPLVAKGFLLSAIAASRLWHSQFELLARSHKHPQLLDLKLFPLHAPLVQFCGADELWILLYIYTLSSPNLCFLAFCYFMNPASNKNFIHLLFFPFYC